MNVEFESRQTPETSVEEREKLVRDRILSIQLEYAVKLSKGEIPFLDGENKIMPLDEAIINFTKLPRDIKRVYIDRTGKREYEGNEEYETVGRKILSDIHRECDQNSDLDLLALRVGGIIADAISFLPQADGIEKKDPYEGREDAGILYYKVTSGAKGVEKYGISGDDTFVDLHFESPFVKWGERNAKDSNAIELRDMSDSLKELARNIEENHQDVKFIIGGSWVLDVKAIAKKIGFRGLDLYNGNGFTLGEGFWGQFIDQDGQIKKDEVKQFLETGEPKYKTRIGYIPTKEFLEKYGREKR